MRYAAACFLVLLAMAAAACGGGSSSGQTFTFGDKDLFEAYVAGSLSISHVDCTKTSETDARCEGSDGNTYIIVCASADESGGHDCEIVRRDN